MAVALVAPLLSLASSPAAQAAGTSFAMSSYGAIAVDPSSGRVFVSGDDKVVAFSSTGAYLGTIGNVYGAKGLAFSGGYLWAAETTAAAIAKIDPSALTKVGEYATGGPVKASIAAIGGRIYFGTDAAQSYNQTLQDLDPATGTVTGHGTVDAGRLNAIPGSTTRMLVSDEGYSPYSVYLVDISGATASTLADVPHGIGSNLRGIAVTEVDTFVTASGSPYRFDEISSTPTGNLLMPTGVSYPGTYYPNGIAYSAAKGGVFAGTTQASNQLFVTRRGMPVASLQVDLGSEAEDNAVALATDASSAYVVVAGTSGQLKLTTVALAPTVATVSTTTVTRGQTTRTTITGTGLGGVSAAKLGGVAVDVVHDGPTKLVLDIRTTQAAGAANLVLESPWGNPSVPFTILANTSGTVMGKVTASLSPVAGASVSLTGDGGYAAATTTAANGTFSIANVPAGAHYDLAVAKGAESYTWKDQALTGSGPWSYDVDLENAPAATLERRRLVLPPGTVRRVVTDPGTGRTFVSVGDVIVVADAQGRFLKQIPDQWSVDDLQVVGTKLYAMLGAGGVVSVFDTTSLSLVDTLPLKRANTGSFVVTGNRLHFVDGNDQWTKLAALDLTTRTVSAEPSGLQYTPLLAPIQGAPLHFLSWEEGISSSNVIHWDASGADIAKVATTPFSTFAYDPADFVADSASNRAWNANGKELVLSTMALSGVTYPTGASRLAVARSGGHGGVLVFGTSVSRQGTPTATHQLPIEPSSRSVAIDAAGNRTYSGATGLLVTSDLAPVVNSVAPNPLTTTPTSVVVAGAGLGGASAVRVDGATVSFTAVDAGHLNVSMPALDDGDHLLTVETPWGTSSPRWFGVGVSGPWAPFGSWGAFVDRQFLDMTGAGPDTATRAGWVANLTDGSDTKGGLIESLRQTNDNTSRVDPTVRLYRALLGRAPDPSGLRFWIKRRRSGTWTLVRMADEFASSTEFKRKYGSLTNRQFVTRIYTDVLGRAADPSGVDYWTRQLDLHRRSRGSVMVGFSESSEYIRLQAENTDVAVIYLFLLGRSPSSSEASAWVAAEKGGASVEDLAGAVLASDEYHDLIVG